MTYLRILSALVGSAPLWLTPAPPVHAGPAITCGSTITTDTTLTHDLLDCPGHGLVIGADDVTLDLNGHLIDGDGEGDEGVGVHVVGRDRILVRNGSVRDFVEGVAVVRAADVRVRGVHVSRSSHAGIFVLDAQQVGIRHSSARITPFAGIFVGRSTRVQVVGSTAAGNGAGIDASDSRDVWIANNLVARNVTGMFVTSVGNADVRTNLAYANAFAGIVVESDRAVVRGNISRANGNGMIVLGNHTRVQRNQVIGAVSCIPVPDACLRPPPGPCPDCEGGNGIAIEGGRRVVVADNKVVGTVGHGILLAAYVPPLPVLDTVVRDNDVRGAGRDGVIVLREGPGRLARTLLDGNRVRGAHDDGLDVRIRRTTVTSNVARHNGDFGITVVRGVTDGGDNRARGNGRRAQCRNISCSRQLDAAGENR